MAGPYSNRMVRFRLRKITLTPEALSGTKIIAPAIFYPFGEDPIQFKIFLNEPLITEMAKRAPLSRLFQNRLSLVAHMFNH